MHRVSRNANVICRYTKYHNQTTLPGAVQNFVGIISVDLPTKSEGGMQFRLRPSRVLVAECAGVGAKSIRRGFVTFVGTHCLCNATTYERAAGSYAV